MRSREITERSTPFEKPRIYRKESDHLLQLASAGNRQALDDLFVSNSPGLYQTAFRILSNSHDAEDAVQDGMLCAFRNLAQFGERAKFSTWLHRIVINASLMRLRKRKSRPEFPLNLIVSTDDVVVPEIDAVSADPDPEAQCAYVEEQQIISRALLDLPSQFRSAIELCEIEELPIKEAGQKLGIPESTLKARLFRARRALKAAILGGRLANPSIRAADKNARWHRPEDKAAKMGSLPAA